MMILNIKGWLNIPFKKTKSSFGIIDVFRLLFKYDWGKSQKMILFNIYEICIWISKKFIVLSSLYLNKFIIIKCQRKLKSSIVDREAMEDLPVVSRTTSPRTMERILISKLTTRLESPELSRLVGLRRMVSILFGKKPRLKQKEDMLRSLPCLSRRIIDQKTVEWRVLKWRGLLKYGGSSLTFEWSVHFVLLILVYN